MNVIDSVKTKFKQILNKILVFDLIMKKFVVNRENDWIYYIDDKDSACKVRISGGVF